MHRIAGITLVLGGCGGVERTERLLVGSWDVVQVTFEAGDEHTRYQTTGSFSLLDDWTGSNTAIVADSGEILRSAVPFFLWDVYEEDKFSLDDQPALYELWEVESLSDDAATVSNAFDGILAVFELEK